MGSGVNPGCANATAPFSGRAACGWIDVNRPVTQAGLPIAPL